MMRPLPACVGQNPEAKPNLPIRYMIAMNISIMRLIRILLGLLIQYEGSNLFSANIKRVPKFLNRY